MLLQWPATRLLFLYEIAVQYPGDSCIADEDWYWLKHIHYSVWLSITSRPAGRCGSLIVHHKLNFPFLVLQIKWPGFFFWNQSGKKICTNSKMHHWMWGLGTRLQNADTCPLWCECRLCKYYGCVMNTDYTIHFVWPYVLYIKYTCLGPNLWKNEFWTLWYKTTKYLVWKKLYWLWLW